PPRRARAAVGRCANAAPPSTGASPPGPTSPAPDPSRSARPSHPHLQGAAPTSEPTPTTVDFHFDIMCPWAYQTSLWMRDVRDQLGLDVRWRFFSLEEINRKEGKKHPWEREWSYGWSMMRVGALLRREDPALLDRWYLTAATALHVHG